MGQWSIAPLILNLKGVSGQLHIVFILSSVTRYSEPLNRRLCGTWNWSGPLGEVINLLPVPGIEPPILRCPIHSLVTMQTILAWLPMMEVLPLHVTQFLISWATHSWLSLFFTFDWKAWSIFISKGTVTFEMKGCCFVWLGCIYIWIKGNSSQHFLLNNWIIWASWPEKQFTADLIRILATDVYESNANYCDWVYLNSS